MYRYSLSLALLFSVMSCGVQAASLLDPTRPYDYVPVEQRVEDEVPVIQPREQVQWKLSVIRIGTDARYAIINGRTVRPGEIIDTARVIEIRPSEVVLEYDKKPVVLTLLDQAIKKKLR